MRSIPARSASDNSRRTLPGTPATSTPLRNLLPFGEECAGRDDRMTPHVRSVEHDRAHPDEDLVLDGASVQRGVVADRDVRAQR